MVARKLQKLMTGAGRPRRDRLVIQITPDVRRQIGRRRVAPGLSFSIAPRTMVSTLPRYVRSIEVSGAGSSSWIVCIPVVSALNRERIVRNAVGALQHEKRSHDGGGPPSRSVVIHLRAIQELHLRLAQNSSSIERVISFRVGGPTLVNGLDHPRT